jgi:hypothetical protein
VFKGKKRELVAEDFVYSIKRIFDPKKRSPNLYLIEGNIAGMDEVLAKARTDNRFDYDVPVEGLRALDRYTFQIRLKQPNYNFLYYLAYCNITCAVAREVVESTATRQPSTPSAPPLPLPSEEILEDGPSQPNFQEYSTARPDDAYNRRFSPHKGALPRWARSRCTTRSRSRATAFSTSSTCERPNEFANVAIPATSSPQSQARGVTCSARRASRRCICTSVKDPIVGGESQRRSCPARQRAGPGCDRRDHHRAKPGDPRTARSARAAVTTRRVYATGKPQALALSTCTATST